MKLALMLAVSGIGFDQLGALLGQTAGGSADLGPWVSAGGSVTAVAGIVYIARLMATGELVARDSHKAETNLTRLVERVSEVAEEAHERERDYRSILRGDRT